MRRWLNILHGSCVNRHVETFGRFIDKTGQIVDKRIETRNEGVDDDRNQYGNNDNGGKIRNNMAIILGNFNFSDTPRMAEAHW